MIPRLTFAQVLDLWDNTIIAGDIVLTGGQTSWLGKAIRWGQSIFTGKPSNWRHAMRAAEEPGMVFSQEETYRKRSLEQDRGSLVRVWHFTTYSPLQRELMLQEADMAQGRAYDVPGLVGQGFRWVPLIGDWLAEKVDAPMLTFCSEAVILEQRAGDKSYFGDDQAAQKSPQEINDYNAARPEWEAFTFKLVE